MPKKSDSCTDRKVGVVMSEWGKGKLKTSSGKTLTKSAKDRRIATAIAFSEAKKKCGGGGKKKKKT